MKKLFLLAFAIGGYFFVKAQSSEIDDIKSWLGAHKGKADANTLFYVQTLGRAFMRYDDDSSQFYLEKAIVIADSLQDGRGKAETLRSLGDLLVVSGNFPEAYQHFLSALAIDDSIKYKNGVAWDLAELGTASGHMHDYRAALDYLFRAEVVLQTAVATVTNPNIYLDIASAYLDLRKLDSARYFSRKADTVAFYYANLEDKGQIWINYGDIYLQMYDSSRNKEFLKLARSAYEKAIGIFPTSRSLFSICVAKLDIANVDALQGFVDSTLYFYSYVDSISHLYKYPSLESIADAELSSIYAKRGNYERSYKYLLTSKKNDEDLYGRQTVLRVENSKFQERLREQSIEKAKEQLNQRLQFILIAIFVILFFMFVVYLSRRKIKKPVIAFLLIVSLLLAFEFVTLVTHPLVEHVCKDIPILTFLALVIIAGVMERLHHKLEHIAMHKLCYVE